MNPPLYTRMLLSHQWRTCWRAGSTMPKRFQPQKNDSSFLFHDSAKYTAPSYLFSASIIPKRSYSENRFIDLNNYHKISDDTLNELAEYFEEVFEEIENEDLDLNLSDGVMTINLGPELGTYVINKQTPNRQIWLSSPTSGPKRYDFVNGQWIYSHDNSNLYKLLEKEFSLALNVPVDLSLLEYYKKEI